MNRRQFLRRATLTGALGLAGCTGGGSSDPAGSTPGTHRAETSPKPTPSGTNSTTGTRTPTATGPGTPTARPTTSTPVPTTRGRTTAETDTPGRVIDSTFAVTGRSGGGQVDSATAAFEGDDGRVTVSGTIWGSDGCRTATLGAVNLTGDRLTVGVGEVVEPGTEDRACTQAIVEISYEVTVSVAGLLPETVVVTHDHGDGPTEVTRASR